MLLASIQRFALFAVVAVFGISSSSDVFAQNEPPSGGESTQGGQAADSPPNVTEGNTLPAPAAAEYVGTNQCFQCHRPQTSTWSESKHSHSFSDLPPNYQSDDSCLRCHVTGFEEPGGYVAGTDKDLMMVGCEACHGPGSGHIDAAKRFVLAMPDEEAKIEQEMRDTIIRTPTDKVCIECHISQAHQNHPEFAGQESSHEVHNRSVSNSTTITAAQCVFSGYSVQTCGGCHYDQYKQWRTGKHSHLSQLLPPQYSGNPECQTCHLNADSTASSLVAQDETAHNRIGLACESCHGPALEHVRFNRQLIGRWPLDSQLEQTARHSIRDSRPATTCVQCHLRESHKEHPQFEKQP